MSKKMKDSKNGNGRAGDGGDDYAVGYKKPPKQTRWKKGQSGNKSGRPKKKLGISDIERAFDEALGDLLAVNDNGTVRRIKKLKALAIQTVNKAVKGHHQSANLLMTHYARRAAGAPEEVGAGSTADDFKAEMEALFSDVAAKSQSAATPNSGAERADDSGSGAEPSDKNRPNTEH